MKTSDAWMLYTWLLGVNIGFMVSGWSSNREARLMIGMGVLFAAEVFRMIYL